MKLVFISYHNIGNEGREAEKQDLGVEAENVTSYHV